MKIEMMRFGKPYEPRSKARKKREAHLGVIAFLLIAVVMIALVSIVIEGTIKHIVVHGQEETWAASVASYWGGIIGGAFSGILAFLGVFYTIRYYKDSDEQKERAAVQPFLMVELSSDLRHELRSGFSLGDSTDEKEKQQIMARCFGHRMEA